MAGFLLLVLAHGEHFLAYWGSSLSHSLTHSAPNPKKRCAARRNKLKHRNYRGVVTVQEACNSSRGKPVNYFVITYWGSAGLRKR